MSGLLKRAYSALALFALLHFMIVVGLGVYAFATGRMDRERVEAIAEIVRGQVSAEESETEGPVETLVGGPQDSTSTSESQILAAVESQDVAKLKTERARTDLQRLETLVDQRMLRVQLEIEKHENDVQTEEQRRRRKRDQEMSTGYLDMVKTIGSMSPVNGREALRQLGAEESVKILRDLDVRKRKKIFESCKTQDEKDWRGQMMAAMLKQPVLTGGTKG